MCTDTAPRGTPPLRHDTHARFMAREANVPTPVAGKSFCGAPDVFELERAQATLLNSALAQLQNRPPQLPSAAEDRLRCCICLDSEKSVAFYPCGHMAACGACGGQVAKCPLCRIPIQCTIRVYI